MSTVKHHRQMKLNNVWNPTGILGPLLFLLCMNDMTDYLEKTTQNLYADDTELSSSSSDSFDTLIKKLNFDLNKIRMWLSENKLK